jgi:histone acetyltransferase (RNA polymerase elongator complex component)
LKEKSILFQYLENSAIIREIQTLGEMVPIEKKKIAPQHRGLGKKLVKEAEKISKKRIWLEKNCSNFRSWSNFFKSKRDYWRKLGSAKLKVKKSKTCFPKNYL